MFTPRKPILTLGRTAGVLLAFGAAFFATIPADAHETDQYTMPLDRPMADVGDWLDTVHYQAVQAAVDAMNGEMTDALKLTDPVARERAIEGIRRPEHAVYLVSTHFDDAFTEILDVEDALRSTWAKNQYPGQLAIWAPDSWIYAHTHFIADPRQITLIFKSSTIKAYGVYFGTDKLSHFHHMGQIYYDQYKAHVDDGYTNEEATAAVVREFSTNSVIAETGFLGFLATGVYSNADLAANFMGLKYCINITEPVYLKGAWREPQIIQKGNQFFVNKHVRPESGWFGMFVADQWNEALNPCWYEWDIRADVRDAIMSRASTISEFYTHIDHRPADPAYYDRLAHELSTFEGESYGHSQNWDKLMTLSQICWPAGVKVDEQVQTSAAITPSVR